MHNDSHLNYGLLYTGEKMYIARGASSKLPGYVYPSDQKFSYYYHGGNLHYGEDYQILTCEIPGAYLWRPFQILDLFLEENYHKEVFVDDTNRFLIAQFHGPIDSMYTEEFEKVTNFKDPILAFLEYKRNPSSSKLNDVVAFCMGKSYDLLCLASMEKSIHLLKRVSYLSVHTVTQLSYFVYPEMKFARVAAVRTRLPENAVCSSQGKFYIRWSSSASEKNAIPFYRQRVLASHRFLPPPGNSRVWDRANHILLMTDDPDAFQWKCFSETDVLHNRDSCDSSMSWSVEEEITEYRRDVCHQSYYNVLVEEISGKAYILIKTSSPRTLQELCRNVILASTLGIPNSIDCLQLPISMKEYCKLLIS